MPPLVILTIMIAVISLISIGLSSLLYKLKPIAVFVFPLFSLAIAGTSFIQARASNDLGGLGFIIFAFVFFIAFVVSGIYALVKYAKIAKET